MQHKRFHLKSNLYCWLGLLMIYGLLLGGCGGSNGGSQPSASGSPSPMATSVSETNTPTPTSVSETNTPTPTPLPTVPQNTLVISNMDLKIFLSAYPCEVVADIQNPLDIPAYNISVRFRLQAPVTGDSEADQLNGRDTISPGQTEHYWRYVTLYPLRTEPAYITITVFQNDRQIGQAKTVNPASCLD